MGCWVWKRGEGGKRRKEIGRKNPGKDFEIQILFSGWFFSLFAQLLFTAALLAQTNLNSLQNKMTGRWKDNVCLNISDQPLSWHSQHGESLLCMSPLIISDRAFPPAYLPRGERIFLQLLVGVMDRWIINIVCHWLSLLFLFVKSPANVTPVFFSLPKAWPTQSHANRTWSPNGFEYERFWKSAEKRNNFGTWSPAKQSGEKLEEGLIIHSLQLMNSLPRNSVTTVSLGHWCVSK